MSPPDSTSMPARPRKSRLTKIFLIMIVVVALLGLFVFLGWRNRQPLARLPLPDGGELLVVKAGYGPMVDVVRPSGFTGLVHRYVFFEPETPEQPPEVLEPGEPEDPPRLWLVFEARKANGKRCNVPRISEFQIVEDGFIVGEALGFGRFTEDELCQRMAINFDCYPRRARQFTVRATLDHGFAEGVLPNPFPARNVPAWTPEPIPQTRQVGAHEVVLQRLRRSPVQTGEGPSAPRLFVLRPEIEVREPGAPPGAFDITHIFSDATGNRDSERLPLSEPAWKIHATVRPNEKSPFPAAEIVSSGRITMPGPGELRIIPLPVSFAPTGLDRPILAVHAVLAGLGFFRIHPDPDFKIEPIAPQKTDWFKPSPDGLPIVENTIPMLLVFGQNDLPDALPPGAFRLVRAALSTGNIKFHQISTGFQTATRIPMRPYRFPPKLEPPAPGTELEVQFITSHEESVDFIVPPAPGE